MSDNNRPIKIENEIIEASLDTCLYVVMSNDLVNSKGNLSLPATKAIRYCISQCEYDDEEFYQYQIKVDDFCRLVGIPLSNKYRDIDKVTNELLESVVYIGDGNPKHKWRKFQWMSEISHAKGVLFFRLNDALKPYLLHLRKLYTQYSYETIKDYTSVYSIRIHEKILESAKKSWTDPYIDELTVYMPLADLRVITDTENSLKAIKDFKKYVLDKYIEDFNNHPQFVDVTMRYEPVKEGKKIIGFNFIKERIVKRTPEQIEKMRKIREKLDRIIEARRNGIYIDEDYLDD